MLCHHADFYQMPNTCPCYVIARCSPKQNGLCPAVHTERHCAIALPNCLVGCCTCFRCLALDGAVSPLYGEGSCWSYLLSALKCCGAALRRRWGTAGPQST